MHKFNENVQFFSSVFDLKINSVVTINDVFELIKSKKHSQKINQIRNSSSYNEDRKYLPCVDFRCVYKNLKRNSEADKLYNGFVFLDIDDVSNPTHTKEILFDLPFIAAAWRSTSGKGVHALAYSDLIRDQKTYNIAWNSIAQLLKENNIILCKGSHNSTQLTFISSDENILIKSNFQSFYFDVNSPLIEEKTTNNIHSEYTLLDLDFYIEKFNNLYYKKYIIDKDSNKPVHYSEDLKFDPDKHYLVDHLTKEQLSNKTNNSHTMCYFNEPITSIKINLYDKFYIREKSRKRTIKAILANYLFILNKKHDPNEIYTMVEALNLKCYDSTGKNLKPLTQRDINSITTWLVELNNNNQLMPYLSESKIGITNTFLREEAKNYKPKPNEKKYEFFKRVFNSQMMGLINTTKDKSLDINKFILENKLNPADFKSKWAFCEFVADKLNIHKRTVYNYFNKKCKKIENHYQVIYNIDQRDSITLHFLASIKEMKEKRIKINKKSLAEYSGISRPTVHKYWDEIQKEINKQ